MAPVLLLLLAFQAQDPVRVQARLNDEEIRAGETTVLRVDVETQGERAQIQPFRSLPPGIELQSTRDFDQRQFSIPGGTRRFVSREFVLRARAPGRYRIPSVDVVVAGQSYSTRSALLTVTGAPTAAPGSAGERGEDGVVLRAWLDRDTVFVGQQVTMEAEAMFSQDARLRLRRAPQYEPPSPAGFWVHDLPERSRPTTRTTGGEQFEVQRFRRAFFPMAPGEYEIPPARLEYEARRGLLYAPETRELTSEPLRLVVVPVPGPHPSSFTGAVGSYTARGWLEPSQVPAGEAVVLTIVVEGVGNIKTLPPPALPELAGIDAFPPTEQADMDARGGEIRGSKRFTWVLIPRQAGELPIPEIRYPVFDPEEAEFRTLAVGPLGLSATPGASASAPARMPMPRYIQTAPSGPDPLAWVRSSWFAAAQALPLLLLALAVGWARRRQRGDRPASRRALRRSRDARLKELEDRAASAGPELFSEADAFARQWLGERLGVAPRHAHQPETLRSAGVGEETARAMSLLLDRMAAARYAPDPPGVEATRDIIRALNRLLSQADREAPPGPSARSGRAAAATGVVLYLALAPVSATGAEPQQPAAPQAAPSAVFQDGVRAFDEERYAAAAESFDRYVRLRPDDAAGWYNLGTAYHRAENPGYAVWAWLKVPRLDPRHDDVRHNLRVADVPPELVHRVAPAVPLRTSELFFLASLGWMIFGVAGGAWVLWRRTWTAVIAPTALFLAIGLSAAGWASTRGPETRIVLDASTLRAAPTLRAEPVAELEPGTGVVPVESRGDWLRARTLSGHEGWIERTVTRDL